MKNQQQGDYQVLTNNGVFAGSHIAEIEDEVIEESHASLQVEGPHAAPIMLQAEQGSIAYELLLLQQRLAAYEQLHIEEMAELRQEMERLRRAFLQETNSHRRAMSPARSQDLQDTKQDAV